MHLALERLKELLEYDPLTGEFVWKKSRGRVKAGTVAGTAHNAGYRVIRVEGARYLSHRLAWFYMTGSWPKDEIDHRDGVRDNNKFKNLRDATHKQNLENQCRSRSNTSGHRGVTWNRLARKWQARIKHNGRHCHLGLFDHFDDAVTCVKAKRASTFTHCDRPG